MDLSRIKSHGLGHVAIDDSDTDNGPSGNVIDDGRVKVQFHDTPQALAQWCEHLKEAFAADGADSEHLLPPKPSKPRRTSTVAFLPGVEKPAEGPRLNIAIHIVGSRGDVQPFIPIAQLLMKPPYGHRVRICTHASFKEFVEGQGVEFFNIGGDPEALMAYMVKNPGLLPNKDSLKEGDVGKRRKEMMEIISGTWRSCIEAGDGMGDPVKAATVKNVDDLFLADVIIANPPSMGHIHCAQKLNIPLHMVFTMPWSPTKAFPHPLAAMSYGDADAKVANYLSFMMMELLTWQGLGDLINKFRRQTLHLDPISPMWGFQLLSRLRIPYSYLWSQTLIPKPSDWDDHLNITGFSFLPLASSYTPPKDLLDFLEAGPPPIYIGFGSIVVKDPQALTNMILKAVELAGVRAIVSKGWGGVGVGQVPDNVYLIGNCPHDWLFQRVSAVVHHGGAGTTAAGIAAGRPTVIVPFFGDQPFWGQMMARAGAGPVSVPYKELTAEILADSIKFSLKPEVQEVAKDMAIQIGEEDGAGGTAQDIQDRLDIDSLRCDICPDRLASWLDRKSGAHLSGFAVGCLIDAGLLQSQNLKLLRHRHWYVDEGAEYPLVGAVAAVSGFASAIGTATSDYAERLRNSPGRGKTRRSSIDDTQEEVLTDPAEAKTGEARLRKGPRGANQKDMEILARKMATKTLNGAEPVFLTPKLRRPVTGLHQKHKKAWRAHEGGRNGRVFYVTRVTGKYIGDLAAASARAPVAFFYNIANGFHNAPSNFWNVEVRRRDEITGLGSGLKVAGKEFVLGFYDAFSGIVTKPYEDTKARGIKGLGRGLLRGGFGVCGNLGAACFGLPGYALKGFEKEMMKHTTTRLKAELLLIRLRQGHDDWQKATEGEREEVVRRWKALKL
ncbi:hypothetical protein J7337_008908 [Fusarium musae]|uniref:Glycosyltransferase family 28 N-terminal domain-containing protein n=1 Tax=Fusarium musae TaxID=1042133 RepID=A0A9P8DEE7_9HYPO|nr:hypothetical protein J7337_008908 [Fusarium musae]KAG9500430.1 hypothetical protein J7337_008908 [Fusarium musae]